MICSFFFEATVREIYGNSLSAQSVSEAGQSLLVLTGTERACLGRVQSGRPGESALPGLGVAFHGRRHTGQERPSS